MDVLIANIDLQNVINTLINAKGRMQDENTPCPARVLVSIRKIISDVALPLKEFEQLLPEMQARYVKQEDGEFVSTREGGRQQFECKDDEAAEAFTSFLQDYNEITLRKPLTGADWDHILIVPAEERYLRMITKGEALTRKELEAQEQTEQKNKSNQEEE